ncbi:hypothetical protein BATDEDRAFT_87772 [Batrachochytrium dendrobatidis JAM81]|uniref:Uncharacterized protein n=1 Tax=Batrachochytrium dendrobatidis (strain JAM81 / FGSC 10211) TaxID=684364 RepID=F4P068_BATDJ|nr:uncharacterized protein BATDEDRAFT_87772 [Batrachochytrium dendrobatidis JAM81]XP_006681518.1 uncharacterized protein BATDEDRAFT_91243 [Batrachochytrium dendrobatidis JAM81]EGF77941.1 hypothetical protein BATDEDRAFT_91243 [Batrachochytrium dendrobatidis JAM81]EGF81390.1 hypothetical protein BATDEDRAFT_87772 [Batrachochytrium dendrobatidis JAM81]|eukprot:XP_006678191.1 hypothetical protein BATDEDRAFT_87772 [Batrachochytrium dendrobatidis JAM81]
MENKHFYIQYLDNQPVRIDIYINNERTALRPFPLDSVGDLVVAIKQTLSSKLGAIDPDKLTIHYVVNGPAIPGNTLLTSIQHPVGSYDHSLVIKSKNDSGQSLVNRLTVDGKAQNSMLPFKLSRNPLAYLNVQYVRFGYCKYLADTLGVQLNFDNLPHRDYDVNSDFFRQIMGALLKKGIKRVVFDESQRHLGLIEFIVKEGAKRPHFIITGTPPHGKNAIDYGGSASARMAGVNLSDLRPPEVKQLIRAIFQIDKISSICVLNFWTVFGGDPYLYQLFAKDMLAQLDDDTRSKIALGEKFPQDLLHKCIDEARTALRERGISADLLNAIPTTGVSKMAIQQDLQKDVSQLVRRGLLKEIPYFSDSKKFRICWTDYNEGPNIVEKSWARCRGYAMENIICSFVGEALFRKLGDILNLPSNRYELYEYFYDGTDADILLRERTPSSGDIDKTWKRHWVVFNIKTSSDALLNTDSVQKFSGLCKVISMKENDLLDKCSLILVAAQIDEATKEKLLVTWQDFNVLGVYDLDYLFSKVPEPAVKTKHNLLVVERTIEKEIIEKTQHDTISLSGRYRCGKTTFLKECYGEDNGCIFVELPESKIQPLSLELKRIECN